jgi:hypothetical protein
MIFAHAERAMTRLGRALASAAVGLLVVACSATPSLSSPAAVQQRTCGRLTTSTCDQVIATVGATVPAANGSRVAVVDYALPPASLAESSGSGRLDYLVAFAPWGPQATAGPYLSPPMWRVTDANGQWSATPIYVTDASVCFVILLRDASLTDYTPSFPSGVCE